MSKDITAIWNLFSLKQRLQSCLFNFMFQPCFLDQMALCLEFINFCSCFLHYLSAKIPGLIFLFPGLCASILVLACRPAGCGWSQKRAEPTVCLPHGVEDGSILHNAEQLVGRGHVVRYGPFPVAEEGVRCPDLADHQVVEPQDLNGALELKSLVDPGLAEEHVHSVLL